MKNLLEVAKQFERQSKSELEATNEAVTNPIKSQENHLIAQLEDSKKRINNAIQKNQNKTIQRIYRWSMTAWLLFIIVTGGTWAAMVFLSAKKYDEMKSWQASMMEHKAMSNGIKVETCGANEGGKKVRYRCVKIAKSQKGSYWGENGDWVAIEKITE